MLLKWLIKNDSVLGLVAITVFLLLFVSSTGLNHIGDISIDGLSPLEQKLLNNSLIDLSIIQAILSALSACIVIFQLHRVIQSLSLLGKQSNLSLIVAAIAYFYLAVEINTWVLWLQLFMVAVFFKMLFEIMDGTHLPGLVFRSAGIVGLLSFFGFGWLVLLIWLVSAIVFSNKGSLRTLFIIVIGYCLPLYFIVMFSFIFDFNISYLLPEISADYSLGLKEGAFTALALISVLLYSSVGMTSTTLRDRRKWQIILIMFFSSLLALLLSNGNMLSSVIFIPAVVVITKFLLLYHSKWVKELFLIVFLTMAIIKTGL